MTRTLLILGAVGFGILAVLRPWTIRPIAGASPPAFDPAEYVTAIWGTRLRQAMTEAADIAGVTKQTLPPGRGLLVQGVGVVISEDSKSRVGLVHVRFENNVEADVQVGPVIRGTAIRDALPFIHFSDFANQIDYAQVALLLNERILEALRRLPTPATLVGQRVRVVGALPTGGSSWEITPITFDVVGGTE